MTFSIALYALKRREEPSAIPFAMIMLAATIHSFGYGFELFTKNPNGVVFWVQVEYIGIAFFPFLLVWMTRTQKNSEHTLNTIVLILFFSLSFTTFFLVQSNHFHELYYSDIAVERVGNYSRVFFIRGPWYYVHSMTTFIAFLIIGIQNFKVYLSSRKLYRDRALNAMVSIIIPLFASVIYALQITPNNLDLLPFVYAPIGLLWIAGFIKYGIFDLIPITYKQIFEHITEGVIVLDQYDQVINFNMTAYQVFKNVHILYKGMPFEAILLELDFLKDSDYPGSVFELNHKRQSLVYHLKRTNLFNKRQNHVGKIIVINDITKETEANRVLTTLATQDALTGINNRRYFFDLCGDKIQTARVAGKRISFVLMDIDFFKKVNDTYGHPVGDQVLKEVTEVCSRSLRTTDLIGRYGGEEFGLLIYDAGFQVTQNVIERMRQSVSQHKFKISDKKAIHLTVSFGVYRPDLTKESDVNSIFKKADKSLYKAKSDGRDCAVFYSDYIN